MEFDIQDRLKRIEYIKNTGQYLIDNADMVDSFALIVDSNKVNESNDPGYIYFWQGYMPTVLGLLSIMSNLIVTDTSLEEEE